MKLVESIAKPAQENKNSQKKSERSNTRTEEIHRRRWIAGRSWISGGFFRWRARHLLQLRLMAKESFFLFFQLSEQNKKRKTSRSLLFDRNPFFSWRRKKERERERGRASAKPTYDKVILERESVAYGYRKYASLRPRCFDWLILLR